MAGRPKIPTPLKVLRGNPGKRPIPKNEPKPEAIEPEMPSYLDPIARQAWKRLAPTFTRLGVLTEADGMAFAALCIAESTLSRINAALKKNKYAMLAMKHTVDGAGNEHVEAKANPLVIQQRLALQTLRSWCQEFGTTPSSRGKVTVPDTGGADPQEAFLNGR